MKILKFKLVSGVFALCFAVFTAFAFSNDSVAENASVLTAYADSQTQLCNVAVQCTTVNIDDIICQSPDGYQAFEKQNGTCLQDDLYEIPQ